MKYFLEFLDGVLIAFKTMLCTFGWHDFDYYRETHKCTGIKHVEEIDIRMRECACCGKRWMHPSPAVNGMLFHWQRTDMKEDEVLHYVEI